MAIQNLEQILSDHFFFRGMPKEHIQTLCGCASNVRFARGNYVFKEGDQADTFYCIRSGTVSLEIHSPAKGPIRIDARGADQVLGWSWIVAPYRFYCDARVVEEVRAIALNGRCLREKCEHDKVFGYELYTRFVPLIHRALEATRLQLIDVYGR